MSKTTGEAVKSASNVPLIDWAHLELQTAGDEALMQELLALFRDQCGQLLPGIRDETSDHQARADLAHTLKGSALGVGAVQVAGYASAIEDVLRETTREPGDEIAALAHAIERTLTAIADE